MRRPVILYIWRRLLRSPIVTVVQAAQAAVRDDRAANHRVDSARRGFFAEAEMRSIFMIVTDVVREQPLQVLFVDRDYVIEQMCLAKMLRGFRINRLRPGRILSI